MDHAERPAPDVAATDDQHLSRLDVEAALRSLGSGLPGLDENQAAQRLREFGPNRLEELRGVPLWRRLLAEFTHFFALILWLAAGLAAYAEWQRPGQGMGTLALAVVAVIAVNGSFSFWQSWRAERAIHALRRLLPPQAKVVRGGRLLTLAAEALVPGDMLLLQAGDNVPADCRVVDGDGLRVNDATLTGESRPRRRDAAPDLRPVPLLQRHNLLLAGTALEAGEARALVFATGMRTEFGRIAHLTQTVKKADSHLLREIRRLSRLVAALATALGLVFFAIGQALGLPYWANLMFAIGIIVANVPEGLLPTVTLSLALATQRMARRHALVRHLPAVETLGATTVICTDKTGTLTTGRMVVRQCHLGGSLLDAAEVAAQPGAQQLLRNAAFCHGLKRGWRDGRPAWLGDPMEVALRAFAGPVAEDAGFTLEHTLPFDAERRRMAVVLRRGDQRWLYCKGAPEMVLPLCSRWQDGAAERPLDDATRQTLAQAQQALAARGLRVLALAWRRLDDGEGQGPAVQEQDLVWSGLLGLQDPPRPEVPAALQRCREAGLRVVMVTGDHPQTALAIARETGLVRSEAPRVVTGDALGSMAPAQLRTLLDEPELLLARVSAQQKALVVQALRDKGEVVAATGDGVNDAPALKAAHIGIAMGLDGTDVARSAADMVLLDDNFASIVNAVEEGRAVFENLRKFITYILTSNVPELVPYLAHVLLGLPLPLTVVQILAVDLGTDMLPALALGAERPDPGVMRQPPRAAGERLLTTALLLRAYLWLGPLQAAAALAAYGLVLRGGGWTWGTPLASTAPLYLQATTACLAAIVAAQVVNVFVCRHPRRSAWSMPLGHNRLLPWALGVELAALALLVYWPAAGSVFGTLAFEAALWGPIAAMALAIGALEEARKAWLRRRTPG